MSQSYTINGTFLVRCGSKAEWENDERVGRGANRVLQTGEIGWITGSSDFKIGDGVTKFKNLPFVKPEPSSSPYALRLGTSSEFYTYEQVKNMLDSITNTEHTHYIEIKENLNTVEVKIQDLAKNVAESTNRFFGSISEFPIQGIEGPLYIAKDTGDAYYYDGVSTGNPKGYAKMTNSFDVLVCKLD